MAMKQLFNKNGGVIDIENSQIYENIEQATMPHLEEVDWDVVIATQELIADTEFGNIIALKALKAIMKSDIESSASHALTILDSFFNYCGHEFQLEFIRYGLADKIFQNRKFSSKNTKRFIRLMNSWKKSTTNMEVRAGITKALDEINRKLDGYKLFVMELNNVAPPKVKKATEKPTSKRQDIANRTHLMAIENNVSDASDEGESSSMRHLTSARRRKERQEFEEDYRSRLRQQESGKPSSNYRINSGPESSENDDETSASKFIRHIKKDDTSGFLESGESTRNDSSYKSRRESSSARSHRSHRPHRSTRKREESVDPITGEAIGRERADNNSDGSKRSPRHRSHRHRSHRDSSPLNSAVGNSSSIPDLVDNDNGYPKNNEISLEETPVVKKSHHHRHRSASGRPSSHRSHGSNSRIEGVGSNPRVDGDESRRKHHRSHRKKDGNDYTSVLDSDIQAADDEDARPSRKSSRRRHHRSKDGMDIDAVEPEMRNLSLDGKSRRTNEMAL